MRGGRFRGRLGTVAGAVVLALAGPGLAGEASSARQACIGSVFKLCPAAAMAGDRAGAKACLLAHLSEASPACKAAVKAQLAADARDKPRTN